MNRLLILFCVTSRSGIFHSYRDATTAGDKLQNLGVRSPITYSTHTDNKQGRDLYRATPAVTLVIGFTLSSEGPPFTTSLDYRGPVLNQIFKWWKIVDCGMLYSFWYYINVSISFVFCLFIYSNKIIITWI